jgi:hypothetical protein
VESDELNWDSSGVKGGSARLYEINDLAIAE